MSVLILNSGDHLDNKLVDAYRFSNRKRPWNEYIKSLDDSIIECTSEYTSMSNCRTEIIFKSPAHITLFILRWS